ncbi:MAG: M3 family metallopeptidase [Pseudoflavonifractor sp.]|nr:M3 family metallopeptidase [Alloprevotella sp.]MCM1116022.1 M3 family metallopeptidase [Pseudoflavonifractor sp.]
MKMKQMAMSACIALATAGVITGCNGGNKGADHVNPFLQPSYGTVYDIPPFDQITYDDYLPAIKQGIAERQAEIDSIVNNPEAPTFDNTILAMEKAGRTLSRVMRVFYALNETDSSPEMEEIDSEATPLISRASDEIMMNPALFARVKNLYERRDSMGLNTAQIKDIADTYNDFVRSGALLSDADKKELMDVNAKLGDLYLQFNRNLLAATNAFEIVITDKARLSGLPESSIAQAAEAAKAAGKEGWLFTLQAPSRLPVLQYADDRDLRREMYEGYVNLASTGQYDNGPVINQIVATRARKAALLGYPDYAAFMTANVMAKTPQAAQDLLMQIWRPAIKRVDEEVKEMQALADREGAGITIEPYDYYYYAEKVRRDKYALDEDEVRAYFPIENVRKGIFTMANKLYGVTFKELPDAPRYNPEVKVYDVLDADSNHLAVFMTDYFPRPSKRQGAWMDEMQGSFVDPDGTVQRPIVFNVGNFTRPAGDTPALLTLDEVETMFHEFGHGLHGMLSRAALRSQSGTNVDRDFVELPSQIHEHWALRPELLKDYAYHYKTGELIPDSLVAKLEAASTHNQGFTTTELAGAALLDLYWGHVNPSQGDSIDVMAFEAQVAKELGMPKEVQFRYRSPYFRHIFGSDGYASGYYTYLWAEVLDTDGFELFEEKGVFDPETAASFKKNVLEMGGSIDPMETYVKFRGHEPSVEALLRNRGLIEKK